MPKNWYKNTLSKLECTLISYILSSIKYSTIISLHCLIKTCLAFIPTFSALFDQKFINLGSSKNLVSLLFRPHGFESPLPPPFFFLFCFVLFFFKSALVSLAKCKFYAYLESSRLRVYYFLFFLWSWYLICVCKVKEKDVSWA